MSVNKNYMVFSGTATKYLAEIWLRKSVKV